MAERLEQIYAQHTAATGGDSHPLDPLTSQELTQAVGLIRSTFPNKKYRFNTITLREPLKQEFLLWKASQDPSTRPNRLANVVVLESGVNGLIEGLIDLTQDKILSWEAKQGVQPLLALEDLQTVEEVVRKDPNVIEQCRISGVTDMSKVYCDPWTIGFDERWGTSRRLQQALLYYRSDIDDSQYSHPLDFCPIVDSSLKKVIFIDIPPIRRPVSKAKHSNFNKKDIEAAGGYRQIKPISVTQPEGVSFKIEGRFIEWQNFRFHIGFNYREGLVLSDMSYNDKGNVRPLFHRISLAEMVVPYGNPDFPHQRKHAFDLGEYGAGYMTNPLFLGCDCKGVIHYMDAHFITGSGDTTTVKNAICIHEEDDGVLFKHSDFRDDYSTSIVTRGVKLVVSQIFTAANYEYMVYWVFHMDGTIQLEVKLTGILNTYVMYDGEDLEGYGTCVYPNVNAQNHQHLFCLRIDPNIDGPGNSVAAVDAGRPPFPVGSAKNKYGNAFYAIKNTFKTPEESVSDYDGATGRTWDIFNPNSINPYSGKPSSYKIVSRECPPLLPKENSLVWKRASFARHHMHVTPYVDGQLYPAGNHVPQTSGDYDNGLEKWVKESKGSNIDNADIVVWHTFGITHFPAPEDFPVMPAEPMSLLLRPRHFFTQNPALDVPPSYNMTTSQALAAANSNGRKVVSETDHSSKLAFANTGATSRKQCCSSNPTAALSQEEEESSGSCCGGSCKCLTNGNKAECKCTPGTCKCSH